MAGKSKKLSEGNSIEGSFKEANRGEQIKANTLFECQDKNVEEDKDDFQWSFDGNQRGYRLALEAYRIRFAHLFDPYFALHSSLVEPLPHQISAVYGEILPKAPFRYVLADDPGAGKTIMTGLLLKEMIARGLVERCLIVSPGSLVEQWQDELKDKFGIDLIDLFGDDLKGKQLESALNKTKLAIASIDKLKTKASRKTIQELKTGWDLVIVDEAHKMSASKSGKQINKSQRYKLGELLSKKAENLLFLTATPHNGKEEDFRLFMSLVDPDIGAVSDKKIDITNSMRRLLKEELKKPNGDPLFPARTSEVINYNLSPLEKELYEQVTNYVRNEFNMAENLREDKKRAIGFAMTILQRRLASSPNAIYQSLRRRRENLEKILQGETIDQNWSEDIDEDFPGSELENTEEQAVDKFVNDENKEEMEKEIETLKNLENLARRVNESNEDRKWNELRNLLNSKELSSSGKREKLIIFTEHKDTLKYLKDKIYTFLGEEPVTIYGGMRKKERKQAEERFKGGDASILIATDAAGEGINLQQAHLMINYDLPWNPNRLEQRFGRIHRIGQEKDCYLYNLVSKDTREGMVFSCLLNKLSQEKEALGGKVFDILGNVTFDNKSLKDLLTDVIRGKGAEEGQRAINESLDSENLKKLMEKTKLTSDSLDTLTAKNIQKAVKSSENLKLSEQFVQKFFVDAFTDLGGKCTPKGNGLYEISRYSPKMRKNLEDLPQLPFYVCFNEEDKEGARDLRAKLLFAGNPLLNSIADLILEKYKDDFYKGSAYRDDKDFGKELKLSLCMEGGMGDVKNSIFREDCLIELNKNTPASLNNSPELRSSNKKPLSKEEFSLIKDYIKGKDIDWMKAAAKAKDFIQETFSEQIKEIKTQKLEILEKVQKRIQHEIYSLEGSVKAEKETNELEKRLEKCHQDTEELKAMSLFPPKVVTGFMTVPKGLLDSLEYQTSEVEKDERDKIEKIGMETVMDIEKSLGFNPIDVSNRHDKCGYDIKSAEDRWIEVKAKKFDTPPVTVTITRNELQTALDNPNEFILAIVLVERDKVKKTLYLKNPFGGEGRPNKEINRSYHVDTLLDNAGNIENH